MTTETVNVMTYNEFNVLVRQHLNRNYNTLAVLESPNDVDYYHPNITSEPMDPWEQEEMQEWDENPPYPNVLFKSMVVNGQLPPGNYLIRVCW